MNLSRKHFSQKPNSIFEIMHIIFDYEKDMKFRPSAGDGETAGLLSNDVDFNNFLNRME